MTGTDLASLVPPPQRLPLRSCLQRWCGEGSTDTASPLSSDHPHNLIHLVELAVGDEGVEKGCDGGAVDECGMVANICDGGRGESRDDEGSAHVTVASSEQQSGYSLGQL